MHPGFCQVEFVGGPLDGFGEVHPATNALYMTVESNPEGYYSINWFDLKYYWILTPAPPVPQPIARPPWWKKLF